MLLLVFSWLILCWTPAWCCQNQNSPFSSPCSDRSQWDPEHDGGLCGPSGALLPGLQRWRQPSCRVGRARGSAEGGWAAGWHSWPFSISHPKKSPPGRELRLCFCQQCQSYIFCRRQPWSTSQTYLSTGSQGAVPASLPGIMFTAGLC